MDQATDGDAMTVAEYAVTSATFWTPGNHRAEMLFRSGTSDWNTIYACMTEDEYGLKGRPLTGTVVDIGAHVGGVSIGTAIDNPDCHVVAVEAVPANAELLRRNVEQNGVADRVTVIENAAGLDEPVEMRFGYRGSEVLEHHAFIGNSSLAYDAEPGDYDTVTYPQPVTLTSLTEGYGAITLLKIDCEGGEFAILSDPATKDIPIIVGEWHPVRGKSRADFLELLAGSHWVTFTGPVEGPGGFTAVKS